MSTFGTIADLIRRPRNDAPVPFVSRRGDLTLAAPTLSGSTPTDNMEAMGHVGTLFAIVDANAHGTSMVKWHLYRKPRNGQEVDPENRTEVTRHAVLDLLRKPNPFTTRQELIEAGQQHHELTGETILLVTKSPRSPLPLELWNVRPDRLVPVKHPTKFLTGWLYLGPDGEKIPLNLDEVLFIRRPSPLDPYRGISQVGATMSDMESSAAASAYMANFFKNDASPGGIIEVPESLSKTEWDEMRDRWEEQHKGVSRAHRVAILEMGKWVDRKYSFKDMDMSTIRGDLREVIREAYRFPKPMLGSVDDVNRANAEAGEYVFGQWLIKPRAERWKEMLNNDLLPMYFPPGTEPDVEFDYELDVPVDQEKENARITAAVGAVASLAPLGFKPPDLMEAFGLPEVDWEEPPPPPAPVVSPDEGDAPGEGVEEDDEEGSTGASTTDRVRRVTPPRRALFQARARVPKALPMRVANLDLEKDDLPGLESMEASYDEALDQVLGDWVKIDRGWKDALVLASGDAVRDGHVSSLTGMASVLDIIPGTEILIRAMTMVAGASGQDVVGEAAAQGVTINAIAPRRDHLDAISQGVVTLLAQEMAISAAREALRVAGPNTTADEVAASVQSHLDELTDARPKTYLGNALTIAQHQGRMATMYAAPSAAYYGNEVLDANTCKFCRRVDGRWLGNSLAAAEKLYPNGGYIDCEGRARCRGTIVAVYRPEQVAGANP